MKVRQNLYLDRAISDALEALASGPGANKSRLVNDALAAWLARRGTKEIDELVKGRLGRLSRDIALVRRDLDVVLESLALFVRYQLLVTAPLPDADSAALAVGLDRFEKFVGQVSRQVATGKRTFAPIEPPETSS
ncbi:CopG family transcriptional regulator [Sphingomonas mali]|uniref:CopG family transcriptional regulator n=1 Tax=Sphingomonas mali TaxID=40682 RepID=UPI000831CC47|nr:CopG family transcriptional regulator [Sphingomonas mali]